MKKEVTYNCCLNCGSDLATKDKYCPYCGQKRLREKLNLGYFVKDSLSSFLVLVIGLLIVFILL